MHPPPFRLGSLVFNTPNRIVEGAEVYLQCEYFMGPRPFCGFTVLISFVEESKLSRAQVEVAASTQFLVPDGLRDAHKRFGEVVNKTTCDLAMKRLESVLVTMAFTMSRRRAGSYICQLVPLNETSVEVRTLTKWMRLELRRGKVSKS
ncbi:unnamed protein product [Hydatigera taeniaeformis]|uniref:Uncharacterized protein n=1 Tax=Hydatigena taeniaeformis TaxID=6205 RepID=A0A3P7EVM2_HYDTA|nr:unnamed protein product [Hydatigera taeniaeformis]